jgi:Lon-like protease
MEEPANTLPVDLLPSQTPRWPTPHWGLWRWIGSLAGFVVAATVVGGLLYRVPYVALVPGSARDTEDLVLVEGTEAFPSAGQLLYTTVRFQQRPNLWEYLWLQADDDAQIVPEEVVFDGRTPDENRKFNLQQMNDSKHVAAAVALQKLGYHAISSDGVIALEVVPGSAAAGVLQPGDTVVAIDGAPVQATQDLLGALSGKAPGDAITLRIEPFPSDGEAVEPKDLTVVLGDNPDTPGSAFLGVRPTDRVQLSDDLGFDVEIDSGSVGGPSAGLAFTLAVLDKLTDGELTGGATVAVTGTIDAAGNVGPIGGGIQKAAAVRHAGASAFIVPTGLGPDEIAKIRERAGSGIEVIPVSTLDEALSALGSLGGDVGAVPEYAAGHAT